MKTRTKEVLDTPKEWSQLPTRTVSTTPDVAPPHVADRYQTLRSLQKVELPDSIARPKSTGPTLYSTLFFRVLLVSAIGLTLLGMSRTKSEPERVPFTPEILTGDLQVNPQSNGTSVDDPPPDIFVQPAE